MADRPKYKQPLEDAVKVLEEHGYGIPPVTNTRVLRGDARDAVKGALNTIKYEIGDTSWTGLDALAGDVPDEWKE